MAEEAGLQTAHHVAGQPVCRVLVVEDEAAARQGLVELLTGWGFVVTAAQDGEEALTRIEADPPDLVLADLAMPRCDGLSLLQAVRPRLHTLAFIMMTGRGSVESAVRAMKDGATDYVTKPIDLHQLRALLTTVLERLDARRARREAQSRSFARAVGESAEVRAVFDLIEQAALTEAPVLVGGEAGTGQEVVARTIHALSPRAAGPFVPVSCAAIAEDDLEPELFGSDGGEPGVAGRRQGRIDLADGGTLFLDEITEIAPEAQAKLVQVLQEHRSRRPGDRTDHPVDVRVIAAMSGEPHSAVEENRLPADLYRHLGVVTITLPPLRYRPADVGPLARNVLSELSGRDGQPIRSLADEAVEVLERYPWPGNLRELRNVVDRAVMLTRGDRITLDELPPDLVAYGKSRSA